MTAVRDLGDPIATGRSAQIFAWPTDPQLVVKLFAEDYPGAAVDEEQSACVEAYELGITPLACEGRVDVDGRPGLLLERVEGESLNRLCEKHPLRLREISRILARTHAALHVARSTAFPDVRQQARAALDTPPLAFLTAAQRATAERVLAALPDGGRVLHMDFHPENVFAHRGAYAVIDWPTAMRGAPAADVAATVLLLRDAELWPGTPLVQRVVVGMVRRMVLSTYLAEYRRLSGITDEEIERWRPVALILRMSILDIPSERDRFRQELIGILDSVG